MCVNWNELQYLACATVSRNRGCNAATRSAVAPRLEMASSHQLLLGYDFKAMNTFDTVTAGILVATHIARTALSHPK